MTISKNAQNLMIAKSRRRSLLRSTALATGVLAGASFLPATSAMAQNCDGGTQNWECDDDLDTPEDVFPSDNFTVNINPSWQNDVNDADPAFEVFPLLFSNSGVVNHDAGSYNDNVQGPGFVLNGGDEVTLNVNGRIQGGSGLDATGDGLRVISGWDVVVVNVGAFDAKTLDGLVRGGDDGMLFTNAINDSLTINNKGGHIIGDGNDADAGNDGEGILISSDGSQAPIAGNVFINNGPALDGAGDPIAGTGALIQSLVTPDNPSSFGGHAIAVYTEGDVTITNSEFSKIDGAGSGIRVGDEGFQTGDVIITNAGSNRGRDGAGMDVRNAGAVSITNSSFTSNVGATDGLFTNLNKSVALNNDGGLYVGLSEDGLDLNETKGVAPATNSIDISNNGGLIAGFWDGIDIDDTWEGDTVINNSTGLVIGVNGDGIEIEDIDGAVRIDNSATTGAGAFDFSTLAADVQTLLAGAAPFNTGQKGIFGGADGIDIDQVDNYVFIDNVGGSIVGASDDGVQIEDVEGDQLVSADGTQPGPYGVVILNDASTSIKGQDFGVTIETVERGDVLISNVGGTITGVNNDGIRIEDTQARDTSTGNVEIDNTSGKIEGGDDGVRLDDIDGNVRIANADPDGAAGVEVGGSIVGKGDEGVEIDDVEGYVYIDNKGGHIEGQDGDAIDIDDVEGGELVNADGTPTGTYGVVIDNETSLVTILGSERGIDIETVERGSVLINNKGGSITGANNDAIRIQDTQARGDTSGNVDIDNSAGGKIISGTAPDSGEDGIFLDDIDGHVAINNVGGEITGNGDDGIDIDDIEHYVFINNSGSKILGADGHGIFMEDVQGDVKVDKAGGPGGGADGAAIYSVVVLNNDPLSTIVGSGDGDEGIHLIDIQDGSVYIGNRGGSISGSTGEGIDIEDVWNGNVHIDNSGGKIASGTDDGIELDEIDGNVRIVNADPDGAGVLTGGQIIGGDTTTAAGDDGVDADDVEEYVFIDNRGGGSIIGVAGDGIDIDDVHGDALVSADGMFAGPYAVVVLNASTIKGAIHGINIGSGGGDIDGGIFIENGDGVTASLIQGLLQDGIHIEDVDGDDTQSVDIINKNLAQILGKDDGVRIDDVDDAVIIITNEAGGEIAGENESGIDINDANEDVTIDNAGLVRGKGDDQDRAAIRIDGRDNVQVTNSAGGVIRTNDASTANGDDWNLRALNIEANDVVTIDNDGDIIGRVRLRGDVVFNNTGNSWYVEGFNSFFGGFSQVNNEGGTIFVNGETDFAGLDELNNFGGLIDMRDESTGGVADTDDSLDTWEDYEGGPAGGENARLGVDSDLLGPGVGDADILHIGETAFGQTGVIVNPTNPFYSELNAQGITVVEVPNEFGGPDPAIQSDDFFLEGGPFNAGLFAWDLFYDPTDANGPQHELRSFVGPNALALPSVATAAQEVWHKSTGLWLERTADLRAFMMGNETAVSTADLPQEPDVLVVPGASVTPGVWAKGFGTFVDRDRDEEVDAFGRNFDFDIGYEQTIGGVMGGVDFGGEGLAGNDAFMVGLLGGYLWSDLDFNDDVDFDVEFSGPTVGAYATYLNNGLFVDGLVKADILEAEGNIAGGPSETTDIVNIGGRLDTGYRIDMRSGGFFIEPQGTVAVVHSEIDDLDIFGGTVEFDDTTSARGRLGMRVGTSVNTGTVVFTPDVTASIWHEFSDGNSVAIGGFGPDINVSDDSLDTFGEIAVGVGITNPGSGWSTFVRGNAQFGDDYLSGSGHAGARYNW